MAKNGELCFEPQQVTLGGAIELPLLGYRIPAVSLGDVARHGESRDDHGVGGRFRFTSRALPDDAQHFAAERDGFLPNFEVPDSRSHVGNMDISARHRGIKRAQAVPARCMGSDSRGSTR